MTISSSIKAALESMIVMMYNTCKKIQVKTFFNKVESYQDNMENYEDSLIYYEYTLHHKLRAAWARVHGLVYLLNQQNSEHDEKKIKRMLSKTLEEMDKIMNDVSNKLSCRKINSKS